MQLIRKGFRIVGRILVFLLLALLCISRLMHQDMVKHTYLSAYQNFRQMGLIKRMFFLPFARDILQLFDILLWIDIIYEGFCGILILFGKRLGGWMMFFWYLVKVTICYSPYLLKAPRLPFTSRQRFQIVRNFAILGVSLALTHLYRPMPSRQYQDEELKNQ